MIIVTDQRTTLRHTVSDSIWEFDLIQKIGYFLIHGGSSYDDFTETTTQSVGQLLIDLCINTIVQQRDTHGQFHRSLIELWSDHLLIDLFQNQRNRQNKVWFDFFEGFQQNFRRR